MNKILVLALGGVALYLLTSKKGSAPATPMGAAVPGSNTSPTPLTPNASFFAQAVGLGPVGAMIAATIPPGAVEATQGAVSAGQRVIDAVGIDPSADMLGQD